jgi:hypothetical protein
MEPTWKQAFHYAFLSGYTFSLIVGLVLIAVAIILLLKYKSFKQDVNIIVFSLALFVLVAGGMIAIYIKPASIKFDNAKAELSEEQIKHYQEVGTDVYFDSLFNENRLLGAGH